jgi:hypothetical protein
MIAPCILITFGVASISWGDTDGHASCFWDKELAMFGNTAFTVHEILFAQKH